jgi:hypothetical protein
MSDVARRALSTCNLLSSIGTGDFSNGTSPGSSHTPVTFIENEIAVELVIGTASNSTVTPGVDTAGAMGKTVLALFVGSATEVDVTVTIIS